MFIRVIIASIYKERYINVIRFAIYKEVKMNSLSVIIASV